MFHHIVAFTRSVPQVIGICPILFEIFALFRFNLKVIGICPILFEIFSLFRFNLKENVSPHCGLHWQRTTRQLDIQNAIQMKNKNKKI